MDLGPRWLKKWVAGSFYPMVSFDADWKPVAFKEWQVVVDAIAAGEQSVILRKGGISEGKAGFQWIHDRFFLFPTLFHEQDQLVKPAADGKTRQFDIEQETESARPIPFGVYVEATETGVLTDWDEILKLEPYHIWTEPCIRERYDWGDEPGISYAVVKATVLKEPWLLPDRKGFGGCRSWIGLPADENGGFQERLGNGHQVAARCGYP